MFKKNKLSEPVKDEKFNFQFTKRVKTLKRPRVAVEWLQESLDIYANVDKQVLENFILDLRQIAQDLQFKYYKARCKYIIIPPEDAIAFTICYVLGSLPVSTRFSSFEGEVQELLKVFSQGIKGKEDLFIEDNLPIKELDYALDLIKEKYPIYYMGIINELLLVPVFNFSVSKGTLLTLPHLHSFGLFRPKNDDEEPLLSILHAMAHLLHYKLTDDLEVIPPGFFNLYSMIFDDEIINDNWAEIFAELMVASLLYQTENMSLVAYMELSNLDHKQICKYLSWLEKIFASILQENMQKLIFKSKKLIAQ